MWCFLFLLKIKFINLLFIYYRQHFLSATVFFKVEISSSRDAVMNFHRSFTGYPTSTTYYYISQYMDWMMRPTAKNKIVYEHSRFKSDRFRLLGTFTFHHFSRLTTNLLVETFNEFVICWKVPVDLIKCDIEKFTNLSIIMLRCSILLKTN